jgi:arylsulfatase
MIFARIARYWAVFARLAEPRTQYVYRPGTQTMPLWVGPRVSNRPHAITADAEIPAGSPEGVLPCQGSNAGGWSFYVKDGRLCYTHNYVARATYQVRAPGPLPAGRHQLRFEFEPTGTPDIAQAKALPAGRNCTWMASSSRKTSSRSPPPSRSTPAG